MILNRQRRVRVSLRPLERFLACARRALHVPTDALTVCFVSDAQMARWNRSYRGKNRPTDVLSFPSDGLPKRRGTRIRASRGAYLGDVAIAPGVALRNARIFGRSLDDEMRILILHGMLHLLGYDHETDSGQMDRRERRLRRVLGLS